MNYFIIKDATSQTLTLTPMGQASSVSWSLIDATKGVDSGDRVLASGAASVASWTLTTSASAGPNTADSRRVSVTGTTGATIGAPAVIIAADGSRELVTIAGVTSGSAIKLDAGLVGTYASGSTVAGVLCSASIPDSVSENATLWANNTPLRMDWTYTVDSVVYRQSFPVLLQRASHSDFAVAEAVKKLKILYPDISGRLPDYSNLDKIAAELASEIADDMRIRHIDPTKYLLGPQGDRLLVARLLSHFADTGYKPGNNDSPDGEYAAWARQEYRRRFEAVTVGEGGHGTMQLTMTTDTAKSNEYRPFTLAL